MDKQTEQTTESNPSTEIIPPAEDDNREQVDRLGTAKISKLMMEFAIPSIIGLVVNGLYNLIDSVFMGRYVGADGLATATVAMPLMFFVMAVSILVGAGGNALVALRLGEGKHEEAEKVTGNAFTLTLVFGVAVTVAINVFMDPLLGISGATEQVWDYCHTFIRIISAGLILQSFGMGFNNFMRTAGDPNLATGTMVVGTVLCIVLNWLFVIVLGFGIVGSAWATVIGQALSAVLVFYYFVFSPKAPFKIRLRYLGLELRLVKAICALGSASFVLQMAASALNLILNNQLVVYGAMDPIGSEGALAAIGVVSRIITFGFFPILGVAMAVQPLFGYNYGAQNFMRVKEAFRIAMIWATGLGLFFWLLVHLFPTQIVGLFGISEDLLHFTVLACQVQMFFMPVVGLQVVAVNYFQSSGQPLKSMFLSLTRQLLYLIPLLYILPLAVQWLPALSFISPLQALYYSYPIADCLSVATAGSLMLVEFRRLNKKIKGQVKVES